MSRVYHVTKRLENRCYTLVGIYTNRKILLEALEKVGIEDCYIKGSRKNKPVNTSSLSTGFYKRALEIFKTDLETFNEFVEYRILEIEINKTNPQLMENE